MKFSLNKIAPLLLLFGWLFLPAAEVLAQSGGLTGAFSRIGFGPRGISMGNALTATVEDGSYSYYNPAHAAAERESIQLDFSSAALSFDRQLHMVGAHFQLPPSAGISISLINARTGNIDGRTTSGYHTETLSTSEYQLISNFGIRLTDSFSAGVGIKYNLANFHSDVPNSSGVGFDLGFMKKLGSRWVIGAAVHDLFATNRYDTADLYGSTTSSETRQDFPTRIKTGLSAELSDQLLISAEYEVQVQNSEILRQTTDLIDGRPVTRTVTDEVTTNTQIGRIGGRYLIHERITVRSGVQLLDINHDLLIRPSGGFSLHLPFDRFTPSIDYAFAREPGGISTMHLFSIRIHI